jgi:hypothetical protein
LRPSVFSCQPGGEAFGVGADRAGRVPTPAFPAGDRVEPFVDHGVPTVALAGHVALHGKSSLSAVAILSR